MNQYHDDIVVQSLKDRFFELCKKEDIGRTPQLPAEIDRLQEAIKELSKPKTP